MTRTTLFAHPDTPLSEQQLVHLDGLLNRRCQGEPMAYITGLREFWSLPLRINAGALVPRPETELLVEMALELYCDKTPGSIVELGTGSGAIALALAQELTQQHIIAVERYQAALDVAAENIERHGQNRVLLVQGNWLDAIADNSVAMVIANPPYLASNDPHLPGLQHEPSTALISGQTGLEDLECIIAATRRAGIDGCTLLLEHGYEQGAAVRSLLELYTYTHINTQKDLAGLERISYGYVADTVT